MAKKVGPAPMLPFHVTPEHYAEVVRNQKAWINAIADKLEQGKALEGMETDLAAAILRAQAKRMKEAQPRPRGQAPKIDPATVAFEYARLRKDGAKKSAAIDTLAETYDVSVQAIKNVIAQYGHITLSWFGVKGT